MDLNVSRYHQNIYNLKSNTSSYNLGCPCYLIMFSLNFCPISWWAWAGLCLRCVCSLRHPWRRFVFILHFSLCVHWKTRRQKTHMRKWVSSSKRTKRLLLLRSGGVPQSSVAVVVVVVVAGADACEMRTTTMKARVGRKQLPHKYASILRMQKAVETTNNNTTTTQQQSIRNEVGWLQFEQRTFKYLLRCSSRRSIASSELNL